MEVVHPQQHGDVGQTHRWVQTSEFLEQNQPPAETAIIEVTADVKIGLHSNVRPDCKKRWKFCGKEFTVLRKLQIHCSHHHTALFCKCGYTYLRREEIRKHQKADCTFNQIYQVDDGSLPEFIMAARPLREPQSVLTLDEPQP